MLALLIRGRFIIRPFIPILAWSGVLAVAFYPAFSWVAKVLGGRPKTAAAILTLITLGIVLGPATWLGVSAVDGGRELAHQFSTGDLALQTAPESIKSWPVIGPTLFELWDQAYNNIRAVLREVAPYLRPLAGPLLSAWRAMSSLGTLQFLVSVFVAGFLFPHGPRFVGPGATPVAHRAGAGRAFSRTGQRHHPRRSARRDRRRHRAGLACRHRLQAGSRAECRPAGLHRAAAVDRANRRLPRAAAGDHLDLDRQGVTTALAFTVFFVLVGFLDTMLKPLVMGRGPNTPTIVIFVGVIGGTLAHGIVGLFIGPIILSVAWEMAAATIRTEDRAAAAKPNAMPPADELLDSPAGCRTFATPRMRVDNDGSRRYPGRLANFSNEIDKLPWRDSVFSLRQL